MNWIIIPFGVALVLALIAAVVGPFFVDWSLYRSTIEANASRILGAEVTLAGETEVRLLPSPRLTLHDVRIGPEAAPLLASERIEMDVALAPLVSGEIRVRDLHLTAPVLTARIDGEGNLALPSPDISGGLGGGFGAGDIAIESVSVDGGTLRLVDTRSDFAGTMEGLDLEGEARSLAGPFSVRGTARVAGEDTLVRVAGGTLGADGTMALSIRLEPQSAAFTASFDGRLSPTADAPRLIGTLDVETEVGTHPATLRGTLTATPSQLALAAGTLTYGAEPTSLELSLRALSSPASADPVVVTLGSRQIDLDRLAVALAGAPNGTEAPPPAEALRRIARFVGPLAALADPPGSAGEVLTEVNIGALVLGGSLVREVSLAARTDGDALALERLEARFPGEAVLDASGTLADGFTGDVLVNAAEPHAFARWWTGEVPSVVAEPLRIDADLAVSEGSVAVPRFTVRLGQSVANGSARLTPPAPDRRAVALTVSAPFLDAGDVGDVAALLAGPLRAADAGTDVTVDLAVERVRVGTVEGSSVNVDARYEDGTLTVDALLAQDLAGVDLVMSGDISDLTGAPVGAISGTLALRDGARLGEAVSALLAPGRTGAAAAEIVPLWAPGQLAFSLSGGGTGARGDSPVLNASADGTLGGTAVELSASLPTALGAGAAADGDAADLAVGLALDHPAAGRLLSQLGLVSGPTAEALAGPARLSLDVDGPGLGALFADVSLSALEASLDYEGGVSLLGARPGLDGALSVRAENLAALSPALGRTLPGRGASLTSELSTGEDGALRIARLEGAWDDVAFEGDLSLDGADLSGALSLARADVATLAGLVLGTDALAAPVSDEAAVASVTFGAPLLGPVALDVALSAQEVRAGERTLTDASARFTADAGGLGLRELAAGLDGGSLAGALAIVREGARADLSADLTLDDAAAGPLLGLGEDGAVSGTLSGRLSATSSGFTVAGLVSALSGSGALTLEDGVIAGFGGRTPFDATALLTESGAPDDAALGAALAERIDAASFDVDRASADLAIASGTVRLSDMTVNDAPLEGDLSYDLASARLSAGFALEGPAGSDQPPVAVTLSGPPGAVERTIDVAPLSAWLSLRALESQVEAVEEQNEELAAEADALDPIGADDSGAQSDTPPLPPVPPQPPATGTQPEDQRSSLERGPRRRILDELRSVVGQTQTAQETTVREERLRALGIDPNGPAPFEVRPEDVN